MSHKVMNIFKRYDPTMIVAGCDEGYLKRVFLFRLTCSANVNYSITKYCAEHDLDPEECVRQMRAQVHAETGLTASAGIAPNKVR